MMTTISHIVNTKFSGDVKFATEQFSERASLEESILPAGVSLSK